MPKSIQQEDYLASSLTVDGRAVTPSNDAASSRDSKVVIALLAIQTVILVLLLGGGFKAYHMVREKTDQIDAVVSIVENPSALINQPELVRSLVYLMQNTTSVFFLGDSDGTLPSFANNVFQTDFGTWANDVSGFATSVTNAFLAQGSSSLCQELISCNSSSYQPVQCPDGRIKYCDWTGTVNCAIDSTCVAPSLLTGASIVASVAERLSTWQAIQGSSAGTPALSNGVFRVDVIFEWIQAQMNSPKWQQAGATCESFTQQVRSINWNGTYYDGNGRTRSWDANHQVRQVAGYFDQVCSGLATLRAADKSNTVEDKPARP